jgi:formylglycine-generating enzyme required for sulfatase activity
MGVPPEEEAREQVPDELRGKSQPLQMITVARPFWLGRYPVTRGQFARFFADTNRTMPNAAYTYELDAKGEWRFELRKSRDWRNPGFEQADDDPVVCVSHDDAIAYIEWLKSLTYKRIGCPARRNGNMRRARARPPQGSGATGGPSRCDTPRSRIAA